MMKAWLPISLLLATAVAAQTLDPRARLASAESDATVARQRSAQLEARAQAARDQAERARAAQAAIAGRVQAAEADIALAETRLALIARLRREQERRLAAREQPVVRLVGALQVMARRPAAAALVQPGSLDDLVHVRALLSSLTPQIAAQTSDLRSEVAHARALQRQANAALVARREGRSRQDRDLRRLATVEAAQRRQAAHYASAARLEAERALALGDSARDLQALVGALDRESALRARLASLPGPLPRPPRLSDALPTERPAPEPAPLAYRLPVFGPVTIGFGEALPSGARARGVTIAAKPGALVVAPAPGRITFAGLFRGYGAIAIVDHGGGYTSLITGLGANLARVGDLVQQGGPLGRSAAGGVTVELRRDGRSVDVSQFVA